jgi:hypothetical protein
MWADLAVSGVSSLVKQGVSYMQADADAKSKRAWQAYKNAMTKLADANNQNAITTNERLMEERISKQRFNINRSEYMTSAMAEASAAAEGTGGRSVNMVQFDVERNASMQQANLTADLEAQYVNADNQRMNSAFQAASSMDMSFIPSPNLATYALGFGNDIMKSYKDLKYPSSK